FGGSSCVGIVRSPRGSITPSLLYMEDRGRETVSSRGRKSFGAGGGRRYTTTLLPPSPPEGRGGQTADRHPTQGGGTFQSCTPPPSPTVASVRPSGAKRSAMIGPAFSASRPRSRPVARSKK